MAKRFERQSRNLQLTSHDISKPSCSQSTVSEHESEEEDISNENKIIDKNFNLEKQVLSNWQMRVNLKSTSLISDRYGVSDRCNRRDCIKRSAKCRPNY
ncbi:hypothetical protein AVEN_71686-1 [Araneus ventricosus]|uniref:Uncharacterized protein n=1 Tax=Araneus ventricosus TaxID=182803 RepID=A0A4Y2FEA6_ARAVE|nr:hypothetical protein AVEN_71686-1 [Araneus ventricosus]